MTKVHWFDDNVDRYDSWFERNKPAYESEIEAIGTLIQRSGKGLEVGVGTGRFAAPLGVRFGIEPSYKMAIYAKKRGIEVVLGAGESLPCEACSLDMVLMVTTICFLDDVPAAIKESYRVLRGEGCIVIGFVDRQSSLGRFYERHKNENVFYRPATEKNEPGQDQSGSRPDLPLLCDPAVPA